jgi:UDP-glucose 4-epimerase
LGSRLVAEGVLEEAVGFGHRGVLMKALVTGGAGFIGSHLVEGLMAEGWQVVVLDNLATGFAENIPAGATFIQGAASDRILLDQALPGCDAIFHLAAVSSVQDSLDRPIAVHDVNLTATLVLLESAVQHGVKRFVFSSSAAIYGDTGGEPAREEMKPNPLSHYAVQKLASEYYCGVYHRLHGLETVCLRYFNIFGPRQRGDSPYSGVIAKFLEAARQGKPALIFGDGGQTRDFCPVANVVAANMAAATRVGEGVAGGIFNVGSGHSISVLELAKSIVGQYPAMGKMEHREGRNTEIRHSRANISKAKDILGYQPKVPFEMAATILAKASVVPALASKLEGRNCAQSTTGPQKQ